METEEMREETLEFENGCSGECSKCPMRYECEDSSISGSRQKKKEVKREMNKKQPKGGERWW